MRPIRIELEGFTAFRAKTVVDFEGADLFVFSGPTGSGKSSLIDAMTFALYGSIARYDNAGLVYPIVSQGLQEARVRFDFDLNAKRYTVVRVVRKQQRGETWGAVTKEARLESGKKVLAGSAKELDAEVRKLFGLSFDQFTTCVVLPQGQFSNFLHSTPAVRQDILKELLGIRIYEKMGQLARQREAAAKQEVKLLQERVKDSVVASPDARKKAVTDIEQLAKLKKDVDRELRELDRLRKEQERLLEAADQINDKLSVFNKLKKPSGVDSLIEEHHKAELEYEQAKKAREQAEQAVSKEESAFKKLPDKTGIQQAIDAHEALKEKQEELAEASEHAERSTEKKNKAHMTVQSAKERVKKAAETLEEMKRIRAAQEIASGIKVGDTCPVCLRTVDTLPKHGKSAHLSALKKEQADAEAHLERANENYRKASSENSGGLARVKQIQAEVQKLTARLKKENTLSELRKDLKRIEELEERLEDVRDRADEARNTERQAQQRCDKLGKQIKQAWDEFHRLRDMLGPYTPPPFNQGDLRKAWDAMVQWRNKETETLAKTAETIARDLTNKGKEVKAGESGVITCCKTAGLKVSQVDRVRDEVVDALARAEEKLKTIDKQVKELKQVEKRLEVRQKEAQIAGLLERHLRANAFERWILQEAFDRLRIGGSKKLEELSSGDYSFQLDDQLNFDIIDHRNADEIRSARTLSGGETFLASLALALTLAEQLADIAAEGAAKLESIFLDEGFGALDSDALDLVATTIEELGSRGRMVGLVTHVKELAERIPVQFRITKNQNSSSVERVAV